MFSTTTYHHLAVPLALLAAVGIVGWVAVLTAVAAATRAHHPESRPAGLELGGSSPPALAGMLTHHWRPRRTGAAATLVDLAARKVLGITQTTPGHFRVTVPAGPPPADLTAYEQRVYDLVTERAQGGAVPIEALQLPEGKQTDKWFDGFEHEVIADARRRGLSRPRFGATLTAVVGGASILAAGLVGLAVGAVMDYPTHHTGQPSHHSSSDALYLAAGVAIVVWFGLMTLFRRLAADRDTPEGLDEAARWMGLRENLGADDEFDRQPVTGIAIWDRLLAYGVGLGVAHTAAHDVPLGAESMTEAWSYETGAWRLVHIRYPRHLPPGYGQTLWRVIWRGIWQSAVALAVIIVGVPAISDLAQGIINSMHGPSDHTGSLVRLGLGAAGAIVALAATAALVRSVTMLAFGLLDTTDRRQVEGRVLRFRAIGNERQSSMDDSPPPEVYWQAAVDDGSEDHIRAWRTDGHPPPWMAERVRVRAMVSRRLCAVSHVEQVPEPAAPPQSDPRPARDPGPAAVRAPAEAPSGAAASVAPPEPFGAEVASAAAPNASPPGPLRGPAPGPPPAPRLDQPSGSPPPAPRLDAPRGP